MNIVESAYRSQKFWRGVEEVCDILCCADDQLVLMSSPDWRYLYRATRAIVNMCVEHDIMPLYETRDYIHFDNGSILMCRTAGAYRGVRCDKVYMDEGGTR